MKTQNGEYYEITHGNTERLKKSPIIIMQKLLSEDRKQTF